MDGMQVSLLVLTESSWEKPADFSSSVEFGSSEKDEEREEEEEGDKEETQEESLLGEEEKSDAASEATEVKEEEKQTSTVPKICFRVSCFSLENVV